MADDVIRRLGVEFSVAGWGAVDEALGKIDSGLDAVGAQAGRAGQQLAGLGQAASLRGLGDDLGATAGQLSGLGKYAGQLGKELAQLSAKGELGEELAGLSGHTMDLRGKLAEAARMARTLGEQPIGERSAEDLKALAELGRELGGELGRLGGQLGKLGARAVGTELAETLAAMGRHAAAQSRQAASGAGGRKRDQPGKVKLTGTGVGDAMKGLAGANPRATTEKKTGDKVDPWAAKLGSAVGSMLGEKLGGKEVGGAVAGTAHSVGKLTEGVAQLGKAILPVTGGLYGFALAGVMASGSGQILGYQFQEISRQIASLFAPQVKWLLEKGQELITWFQKLSGSQQAGLRNWLLLAGGISAVGVALPVVVASFTAAGKALAAFQAAAIAARGAVIALNLAWVASPIGLGITLVGAAIAAVVVSTTDWKDALNAVSIIGRELATPFEEAAAALREVVALMRTLGLLKGDKEEGLATTAANFIRSHNERARRVNAGEFMLTDEQKEKTPQWALSASSWMAGITRRLPGGSAMGHGAALAGGLFGWDPAKDKKGEDRSELAPRLGGFEQVDQTYRRIAEASLKATGVMEKTPAERSADLLQELVNSMQTITNAADRVRPATTQ